ncbi:BTAD domain-containing putative transcriptional regulator [Streptomyces sp. NBC_00366]|uniref:BTAD domain-containing putative transcriptional regulator n=1 Tax=Streptomyces sp. NBC_00366 TaxID=2975727 RepID=UPI002E26601F
MPDLPDPHAEAARLDQLRLAAVLDRIEADLALDGGPELVPERRTLVSAHPLSERLYGQLMRALHAGGRPAEALTVFEDARRTLADELGADPSPELSALHLELLQGGERERHRLPVQLTRFVGRESELARIAALLADARLVTLTGPGGAGKTRLAIEAASRHTGVCFVELAPLTDGTQIPYAVLTALGVRDGLRTPAGDGTGRLLAALEDRELLLVLDNCEHLVEEAARIAPLLLGACPGLRVSPETREDGHQVGMSAHVRGDSRRALELLDEGLAYLREVAAPEETADLLRTRGAVLLRRGDTAGAEAHFEQALTLARVAGLPDKMAAARRGLGDAARLSGDTARARVHYEGALEACAANWFSVGETVRILIGFGRTSAAEGRIEEAHDWFRQAAELSAEGPSDVELADTAEALASVAESAERAAVPLGAATGVRGAPAVLRALEETDDLYFDAIAQIHVDRLTKGRVALLGDAGYGATMGGMGTGVAIVGAYVLAGELALAGGDFRTAFAEYETRIRDFANGCQKISGNAGPFFAPATERRIRNRDRMYRVLGSRPLARFFKKLTEKAATDIKLREYPALSGA